MKSIKTIFILALIFFQTGINAQSVFDKYEDYDNVSSVIVTDEMFKLLKEIEPESNEAREEISVLSSLTGLKVFSTEDAASSSEIIADANAYINAKKMTELMRINDGAAKIKFYIVKGTLAHKAKELIMVLTKKENGKVKTVILVVTGDIDLKKLSKLNTKVKIIDGKYLKEVEEQENN